MLDHLVLKQNDDSKDVGFLYGTIPASLIHVTLLKQLDLSNNKQLSGTLSSTLFGKLSNLEYVNLQNNDLVGTLPTSLLELPFLETLILGNNRLTGIIPLWNDEDMKIKYMDLHSNNFAGALSPAFSSSKSESSSTSLIEYLYLNDNQFTGTIPHGFFDSNNGLRSIRLDRNAMNGTIPSSIGTMKQLQYFSMESNLLSGSIPADIYEVTSLHTLNLKDNRLSGEFPELSSSNLNGIKTLILSENYLEGTIPQNWIHMKSLGKSTCAKLPYVKSPVIIKNCFFYNITQFIVCLFCLFAYRNFIIEFE